MKEKTGINISYNNVSILCYADDAVLIADNEDDLQKLLHKFNVTAKKYNLQISKVLGNFQTTGKMEARGQEV